MANSIPDSVFDIPVDNVKTIKRSLFVNNGGDNIYIACFCKDDKGTQQAAIKKTKAVFACHNSGAGSKAQPCGFKISAFAAKFIKEGDILRDPYAPIDTPVCKTCGCSELRVVFSSPIKDTLGLAAYTCTCMPWNTRIDVPLEDKMVASGFYISNYLAHREKVFGELNPKLKTLNAQIKTDGEPKAKKVYIPSD